MTEPKQYNPKYNTSEYTKSLSKQKLHRNNE